MSERLAKFMARSGVCSRRRAEEYIRQKRVTVNGEVVDSPAFNVEGTEKILFDGEKLPEIETTRLWLYYKPVGLLTTHRDDQNRPTVFDSLPPFMPRVVSVGRLDLNSEGLLLLTDDGAFANLLTHPSGGVGKLYRVTVRPRATEEQIVKMSSGVVLDDGVKTQPAVIHVVVDEPGRTVLEITLHEGRNRQIRRMCEAVGLEVIRLKRSAEGPVKLGMLQPGEYRELKKSEISALRNAALKAAPARKAAPAAARRPGPIKHD